MNTRKGRAKFIYLQILLDSGYSSMVVIRRLIAKLNPKKDSVMQYNTQADSITNNTKVKIYYTLTELSTTSIVRWNCRAQS